MQCSDQCNTMYSSQIKGSCGSSNFSADGGLRSAPARLHSWVTVESTVELHCYCLLCIGSAPPLSLAPSTLRCVNHWAQWCKRARSFSRLLVEDARTATTDDQLYPLPPPPVPSPVNSCTPPPIPLPPQHTLLYCSKWCLFLSYLRARAQAHTDTHAHAEQLFVRTNFSFELPK